MTRANRPFGERRGHQRARRVRTGGFARDRDLAGIAAEGCDVALDPLQRGDKVEKAVSAGRMMLGFGGEFGMSEKAQRIETMVDGDDDNAPRGKTCAVVARFGARADDKAAAVNPRHHRQARFCPRRGRRPDVEMEAILGGRGSAEIDVVPHDALHGMGAKLVCRPHACPGRNGLRRAPAQAPERRRGIGNAFVDADAACIRLWNRERAALDRQIFVIKRGRPCSRGR